MMLARLWIMFCHDFRTLVLKSRSILNPKTCGQIRRAGCPQDLLHHHFLISFLFIRRKEPVALRIDFEIREA